MIGNYEDDNKIMIAVYTGDLNPLPRIRYRNMLFRGTLSDVGVFKPLSKYNVRMRDFDGKYALFDEQVETDKDGRLKLPRFLDLEIL